MVIPAMMVDRRSCDRPSGSGLASTLAARGCVTFTVDLRGHGGSRPLPAEGADWSYEDLVSIDIPAVLAHVRRQTPGLPLCVIGHSLGGHATCVSIASFATAPPDLLVLVGANMWVRELEPDRWRHALKTASLAAFAATAGLFGYFPSRRLRIGSADEAKTYVRAFVRWARHGWTSPDGRRDYLADLGRFPAIDVLALNGAGDRWMCRTPCARNFADRLGAARVEFREVSAADIGGGAEPDHMTIVVDPRSRPVWHAIADWLRARRVESTSAG